MSRSLVTQKPIKLPKELEKFFGNPPMVGNEKREDYEALFLAVARALNPTDVILWIQAREFTDISWELQRERRIKAEIIKSKQRGAESSASIPTRSEFMSRFEKQEPSEIMKRNPKQERVEDQSEFLPEAFMLGSSEIDNIDVRIASYLFRRNSILREIERYGDANARKLEKAAPDIIEGEFSDAAE